MDTQEQFEKVVGECRDIFTKKMKDYGTAWRIMRPQSLTDQIYIKVKRIRSLQEKGVACIDEGERDEFIGIVNYAAMALIQLELGYSDSPEMDYEEAERMYLSKLNDALSLMCNKNHDYDEAWRDMRISSITDLILMKVHRTKEIEDHDGQTIISEGIDANYLDMINYSVFALILIGEAEGRY